MLLDARGGESRPPAAAAAAIPPAPWFGAHRWPLAAALLMGAGCAAVWNFGRTLLVDADAGTTVSVVAWIAVGAGGLAVTGTTRWTQRFGPQRLWILATCAIAAATILLALAPHPAVVALLACAVFGWGYVAASGALIEWTVQLDPDRAPAGTALLFVTLILGQAVGAIAIGALIPAVDYPMAFLAAALTAALAVLPAVRTRRRPVTQP